MDLYYGIIRFRKMGPSKDPSKSLVLAREHRLIVFFISELISSSSVRVFYEYLWRHCSQNFKPCRTHFLLSFYVIIDTPRGRVVVFVSESKFDAWVAQTELSSAE